MASDKKIPLKLMVDKKRKRVVWAETDSDFVDVVFSFLTMPIGTIVRLAAKESKMGSMDALYRSIEKLDEKYFQTPACKALLLRPRNFSQRKCDKLAVKIDDTVFHLYYCSNCRVSKYYPNTCPKGGGVMSPEPQFPEVNGVFMKGQMEFVVKDDLKVIPVSATSSLCILEMLEIRDETVLQEMDIEFGREELPHESTVLSPVIKPAETEKMTHEKEDAKETVGDCKWMMMQGKLILRKSSNEVVYLEAREDLINFIVSFLISPLGLVAKLVGGCSLPGCVGNLYQTIGELKTEDHFNSNESKTELLCLKLLLNSIFARTETKKGVSFMKASYKFMLTEDLTIEPFSPSAAIFLFKKLKVPLQDLKEQDITVGAEEVVKLLRAAMTSKTVLTDVFCPKKEEQ